MDKKQSIINMLFNPSNSDQSVIDLIINYTGTDAVFRYQDNTANSVFKCVITASGMVVSVVNKITNDGIVDATMIYKENSSDDSIYTDNIGTSYIISTVDKLFVTVPDTTDSISKYTLEINYNTVCPNKIYDTVLDEYLSHNMDYTYKGTKICQLLDTFNISSMHLEKDIQSLIKLIDNRDNS